MSAAKGARYERKLVRLLDDTGYTALRLPSSGSATDRDLPDILAGEPVEGSHGQRLSKAMALELKSGRATTLYVESEEVAALERFARGFGATPYLCARPTTRDSETAYYCVRPDDARLTDGGLYGLPIAELDDRAEVVFYE